MEDKLSAGDMFFSHPSILVSSQSCISIPLLVPSLPPLEVLPPHSAPRHHHHHQPYQQLYPHQPLALASRPLPSADLAEELVDFASRFKHWRVRLGFTQREVGLAVNCSQPKISNFENLNLSLKSMHKMKPKLENWLDCEQTRSISAATFPPRLWSWSPDSPAPPIWSGGKLSGMTFAQFAKQKYTLLWKINVLCEIYNTNWPFLSNRKNSLIRLNILKIWKALKNLVVLI